MLFLKLIYKLQGGTHMSDNSSQKAQTIWTHNFIVLFFANAVISFGAQMTYALLSLYCRELGATDSVVGTVSGIFALTALAMRPISGPAIDAWNKKTLYLVTITLNAIAMFGYGISNSIPMVIFFRLLHGISNGTSAALCLAMATESLPAEKISSGIGVYMLSTVLAGAIGPGLGLTLSEKYGFSVTYFISAAMILAATLVGVRLDYSNVKSKPLKINLNTVIAKEAIVPAIIIMIMQFASGTVNSFLVLMVTDRNIDGISVYYTVNALAMVAFRPLAGKIADKYGSAKALFPTLAIFMCNLICLAFCSSKWMLWLSALLNAFGYASFYSMLQALAMKITPFERRGAGGSTCYIGTDTGAMLGPMVAGIIANFFGYKIMYLYGLAPLALCGFILHIWLKKRSAAEAAHSYTS